MSLFPKKKKIYTFSLLPSYISSFKLLIMCDIPPHVVYDCLQCRSLFSRHNLSTFPFSAKESLLNCHPKLSLNHVIEEG